MFGMDFIGPLPEANLNLEDTIKACYPQLNKFDVQFDSNEQPLNWGYSGKSKFSHIFMVVDYFSRFVWAFSCSTPDQAEAIRCLSWLFSIFGSPISIYADIGSHFVGRSMANYLQEQNVVFIPAPSGAKRATGMVEKLNDLLEMILKKQSHKPNWPLFVNRAAYELNRRVIRHFGFSAYEILFGFQPPSSLERSFPSLNRAQYTAEMAEFDWNQLYNVSAGKAHEDAVIHHLAKMETRRCDALTLDDWRRRVQKERHDLGVSQRTSFAPGTLVMLYDHAKAKLKLHASYRGPFVVTGFAGYHGKSYLLRQINGQRIKYSYHGDQLKLFRLREGYLISGNEQKIPAYQNLRSGKASHKIPKPTYYFEGAWTRKAN
ncbi:hypothetical protein K3495_g15353 [Podosphaera aphanis]|nr:hypothetical protein K3495_g15353 [Podosphaera aphanis]